MPASVICANTLTNCNACNVSKLHSAVQSSTRADDVDVCSPCQRGSNCIGVIRLSPACAFDNGRREFWHTSCTETSRRKHVDRTGVALCEHLRDAQPRSADGKGGITEYGYDALKRLVSATQDLGGSDPSTADALTEYGYDAANRLTGVTDPNSATTTYVYDDLGNLLSQTSPDTGTTTFTYDSAGDVLSKTDAKGQTFVYDYDAAGRLTSVDAPGTADDITYVYDICSSGEGRVCSASMGGVTVSYVYNALGEVVGHQGIGYAYDSAGRVDIVSYPSGATLDYKYNAAGQVERVELTLGAQVYTLASDITYAPFGAVEALTYGNGLLLSQPLDSAYRFEAHNIPGVFGLVNETYDENGNLTQRADALQASTEIFGYDALNRLDTASGEFGLRGYDYDRNGNRTTLADGLLNRTYEYESLSNRMASVDQATVALDANGNTTARDAWQYAYSSHNRLASVSYAGTQQAAYVYNALGQRVRKIVAAGTLSRGDGDGDGSYTSADYSLALQHILGESSAAGNVDCTQDGFVDVRDLVCIASLEGRSAPASTADVEFVYGQNGELLAEVDGATGEVAAEYVYLNGQPLAMVKEGGEIFYIHNDHLGTPRAVSDSTGQAIWRWEGEPFGASVPNEDPDADGTAFTLNLRFPGQYYDAETGLHYNYFRYYDPQMGRYITSDPIGLEGGLNTFGYVDGNPVVKSDFLGLRGSPYGSGGYGSAIGNDSYYSSASGPARSTGLPPEDHERCLSDTCDTTFGECYDKCVSYWIPVKNAGWACAAASLYGGVPSQSCAYYGGWVFFVMCDTTCARNSCAMDGYE